MHYVDKCEKIIWCASVRSSMGFTYVRTFTSNQRPPLRTFRGFILILRFSETHSTSPPFNTFILSFLSHPSSTAKLRRIQFSKTNNTQKKFKSTTDFQLKHFTTGKIITTVDGNQNTQKRNGRSKHFLLQLLSFILSIIRRYALLSNRITVTGKQ